ncbi:uncharacterized protein BDCG_01629 [Blastomyces dermatitidis ER-3]|uniref:Uncharacterized protein n=1 Tax=Ajellomyces dermatitidis (strain ER-3 / ATCC MYA-2586) TaxID=559297 RepID=A0ABP2EVZ5_AJEDR|nr:uncharacterized protein BDCG_01629 [Blastomyces dermatitidis ER-3]EEQ86509.2 hypothetical protein BDCG_01629 [Blastomyces dermatitidis ER-3]EQL37220.1 hypothetical protein BDFG_01481 [Blastomyces dermatitidis ATCC 26199]
MEAACRAAGGGTFHARSSAEHHTRSGGAKPQQEGHPKRRRAGKCEAYVQASIFLLTRNPADGSGWDFDPSQWITQRHNMDTQWILALNGLKNRAIPELPLPRACLE